jgi:outer membrane protein assembly factor BamB
MFLIYSKSNRRNLYLNNKRGIKIKKLNRLVVLITGFIILINANLIFAQNWPQWRGPMGTGVAEKGNPPVEWSEEKNIRWKTRLPGIGASTPVIWGNNIFVTGAKPAEIDSESRMKGKFSRPVKYVVTAIDRISGKIKWERLAREEIPHEGKHVSSVGGHNSPCTDGERVYAYFGSRGLYCYTIEGDLLWEKDFGDKHIAYGYGEGSSPALYKDRLIVNWDHVGQSFIVVLDAATGKEVWRKNRDEETSWMTPLVVEVAGQAQVITSATNRVRSYNLATGELIWEDAGLTKVVISSPTTADGVVYVMSGFKATAALRAIRLGGAKGDISGSSSILWSYDKDTPYAPSSLIFNGLLYFLKLNTGILTCLDASTGKPHYSRQRLDGVGAVYSYPVGVQDRVYISGRKGTTIVLRHGPEYNVIAKNRLEDIFESSPAIAGDEIYLRGYNHLYCIAR